MSRAPGAVADGGVVEATRGKFLVSTDRTILDLDVIHPFLSERSYWARAIPRATVERAIAGALPFGLYEREFEGDRRAGERLNQVGFARVISDRATFAYLSDVFVLESHRRQGLSKWLVATILAHPDLQGLRRWTLATADAHDLYRQFGFVPLGEPERFMEILVRDIYTKTPSRLRENPVR